MGTMYDKDKFNSEFLGQVEISLVSLSDGNEWSEWHELLSKKGAREAKGRGEIQVKLQWKGGEQAKNEDGESDGETEEKSGLNSLADAVLIEDELDEIEDQQEQAGSSGAEWLGGYKSFGQFSDRIHGIRDKIQCEDFPDRVKKQCDVGY